MVAGVPCMCMSTTPAPVSATTRVIAGSAASAVMSLMMAAPALSAWRATSALVVSIESGTSTLSRERLDDRDHPAQLLVERDRLGPGPARLAPEVEQVGPLGDEPPRVRQRGLGPRQAGRRRRSCPA